MRGIVVLAVAMAILLIGASVSLAAVCPQADYLGTISTGALFEPLGLAVDSGGRLYAADQRNDAIYVFTYTGSLAARHGVKGPTAVAVDGTDRILVGRAEGRGGIFSGEVIVYDSGFNEQFRLGGGLGEFDYPAGIATDADRVYVADSRQNVVKVYDLGSGSYISSFGGYGTSRGNLVNPSGIAVNPHTGNLIVVDSALKADGSKGVGVHEFTPDGGPDEGFLHRLDKPIRTAWDPVKQEEVYVEEPGAIASGAGVVVDNAGRVLVGDYLLGYLHAFEFDAGANAWSPLCHVMYASYADVVVGALAYAPDGRLFVAMPGAVLELGEGEDYRKLVVEPSALRYEGRACGPQPGAQSLRVRNIGPGTLDWSVAQSAGWITAASASGQIVGDGTMDVAIDIDKTGMSAGTTSGLLTVTAPGASVQAEVTVEILPATVLSTSPSSFIFAVEPGQVPHPQAMTVQVLGGGEWLATADAGWIGIAPSAGTTAGLSTSTVNVDLEGLEGGSYAGNITLSAPCAQGSPLSIPVTVTYDKGGTVAVSTNHDDASFTVSGPAEYSGSGRSFTAENVPAGTYTVEYAGLEGFKTPGAESAEVGAGQSIEFAGQYVDLRERLEILASMGASSQSALNEVRVFDGTGGVLATVQISEFWENATPAAGDLDGDGVAELIVAHDMGVLSVLGADGTPRGGLELMPFADRAYLDVKTADLDGDGADEVIVSSLNWSGNGASVRVFQYRGGALVDTGIYFLAYTGEDYYWSKDNNRRGARVGVGDVDGDGLPELLSVQGGGFSRHYAYARMFKVDTSGGAGAWGVSAMGGIRVNDAGSYYSDIAAGDLDGDGVAEVVVSCAPEMTSETQMVRVLAFKADGTKVLELAVDSERGVDVSVGDLDYDGVAELIVGDGAFGDGRASRVRIYGADGSMKGQFSAFDAEVFGVRSAAGEFVGN